MTTPVLAELAAGGVSLWLDDLNRSRLEGNLQELINSHAICGVTTNPTIFEKAIREGADSYASHIDQLRMAGTSVDDAIQALTTHDVRQACDQFAHIWTATGGMDGRVSIEVDPRLAHDTSGTIDQAIELWRVVDRPNAMIKIPATEAGLPAVAEVISRGISVNVTLIFSLRRYQQVIEAHADGIARAIAAGLDPRGIESVASFFISRVDTAIDARLDAIDSDTARRLRGRAAIANAQLAWQTYSDHTLSDQWRQLAASGGRPQRPLWASTGVKDPNYDPARYVIDLAAPGCVNTVPEATLQAVAAGGTYEGDTVTGRSADASKVMSELAELGIDITHVCNELEAAGVESFIASWESLRQTVAAALG